MIFAYIKVQFSVMAAGIYCRLASGMVCSCTVPHVGRCICNDLTRQHTVESRACKVSLVTGLFFKPYFIFKLRLCLVLGRQGCNIKIE